MGKEPFEYSQAQTKVLDGESSQGASPLPMLGKLEERINNFKRING